MNRLARRDRMPEMGDMDILASGAPVYFTAGIAVGVAATMLVFSIAVALDRARLRRGIKRARAAASMASEATAAAEAMPETALVTPPKPAAESGPPAAEPPPEPETTTSSSPAKTPTVEELFAEAFRAATDKPPAPTSSEPTR
jgi:hypothetical protein